MNALSLAQFGKTKKNNSLLINFLNTLRMKLVRLSRPYTCFAYFTRLLPTLDADAEIQVRSNHNISTPLRTNTPSRLIPMVSIHPIPIPSLFYDDQIFMLKRRLNADVETTYFHLSADLLHFSLATLSCTIAIEP